MTRKRTQPGRRKKVQGETAPYVLVVYEEGHETGVVSRTDVPAEATRGMKCAVPDPIDWSRRSADLHDAVIVEFGHDIDYLYQINVSPRGKILKTPPSEEVLAKKREEKEYQRKLLERKRAGADIIAKEVEELEPLSILNRESQQAQVIDSNDANKCTTEDISLTYDEASTSNKSDKEIDNFLTSNELNKPDQDSALQSCGPSEEIDLSDNAEVAKKKDSVYLESSATTSSVSVSSNENIAVDFKCPTNSDCCPITRVLAGGSPSKIDFFLKMSAAIATHIPFNDSVQNEAENKKATDTAKKLEDTLQSIQGHDNKKNEELDCLKPGPNKFPILQGFQVYVTKPTIMSIPPILERFENNSPLQNLDNRPQKRLKRSKADNGISPRQMVIYLLKELIPEERLKTMKPSDDIPDKIRDAIKAYVNYRVSEKGRLTNSMIKLYIYDHIRSLQRDRKSTVTPKRKVTGGDNSNGTLLINIEDIPVVYLPETIRLVNETDK